MTQPAAFADRRRRRARGGVRLALGAALAIVVAACAGPAVDADDAPASDGASDERDADGASAAGEDPDALEGDWVLTAGTGPEGAVDPPREDAITLSIDGERWRGKAACNTYQSTVTIDDDSLGVADVAVTEMACTDESLMAAESAYLAAYRAVDSWSFDGDTLTLMGADTELTFTPQAPEDDATLVGATWTLTSLIEGVGDDAAVSDVPADATLHFADDGSLTGSTGCNDLGSTYELDGSRITLDEPEVTQEG